MAEWSGMGLQIPLRRFDSASDLQLLIFCDVGGDDGPLGAFWAAFGLGAAPAEGKAAPDRRGFGQRG